MHGAARETASGPRRTAEAGGGRRTEPAAPSPEVAATAPRSPRGRFPRPAPARPCPAPGAGRGRGPPVRPEIRQNGVSVRVKPVGRVSWM